MRDVALPTIRFALVLAAVWFTLAGPAPAADWLQFRGPNAAGIADGDGLPQTLSLEETLVWKASVPPGHSSPVIAGERIFLTAVENGKLLTLALDRATGAEVWRREAPRTRTSKTHEMSGAAAPSVASDGANIYVFFGDYGLLSYTAAGEERWKLPLGPFRNQMGMSALPILASGKLVLPLDDDRRSTMIAVDPANGEMLWRADRSEFTRGFSTPVIHRPASGPAEIILPGAFQLAGYSLDTGEKLWWVRGLCWQPKSAAALGDGRVYAHCWAAGGDSPPERDYPEFSAALAELDKDKDGRISKDEFYPDQVKGFGGIDLDKDGYLNERDWTYFRSRNASQNSLMAVRLGGRGDVTDTHVEWLHTKSLPNVASPLVRDGIVYLAKDGGIATALDAATGKVLKMARLPEAMDKYFASPVAAGGRVYFFDHAGTLTVVEAGPNLRVLQTLALGGIGNATPAIVNGRLYVRTGLSLYCFGNRD